MPESVISISSVQGFDFGPDGGSKRIGGTLRRLGDALGLKGLGCTHISVQPGMRAFPFHNHLANDELFVILSGTGTYRYGSHEYPIAGGDICAAGKGGPDNAHQIINTGEQPLEYLAISTMNDPEVVEYPDSGKFAAIAVAPGAGFMEAHLRFIGRAGDSVGYFDGEET
ncbi:MAG: cupin domain-containing protein [Rhodobacteraceae bacterium]|nr:cupin domain-containing protein [Paracoccaceae bacterium]